MTISRILSLTALLPLFFSAACSPSGDAVRAARSETAGERAPERPNVVLIVADDLGARDLGYAGSTFHHTPHLDRLAAEGVVFTDAYAAASICSPTRAALLTGRAPARLHLTDWIPGQGDRPENRLLQVRDRDHLPLAERTLAELLGEAGYATAHVGKWHLGGAGFLPTDQGFDVNVAGNHRGSPPGYFWPYRRGDYHLDALAATGREGEYLTDRLTDEAIAFVDSAADRGRPFFLHLAYYAVHLPLEGKPDLVEKYRARLAASSVPPEGDVREGDGLVVRTQQRDPVYAAMVETLDRNVGRLLAALRERGLDRRTVVIFVSDNGGLSVLEAGRRAPPTSNRPLRAGKGWLYEGGIRVPMIVRWPGVGRAGSISAEPVGSADVFPTVLEAAGAALPDVPLDGESLVPLLDGTEGGLGREALYWHYPHYHGSGARPMAAVRAGDLKLIEWYEEGAVELYDLAADPGERVDLAGERPVEAEALRARLAAWRRAVAAQMPAPNPDHPASAR